MLRIHLPAVSYIITNAAPLYMGRLQWLAGMASSIIFLGMWIASSSQMPSWNFGKNVVSMLGNCEMPIVELLFNLACAISGALGLIFSHAVIGLKDRFRYCGYFTMASGIALICLGIVNQNYDHPHVLISAVYFLMALSSVLISVYSDHMEGRRPFAALDVTLLLICLVSFLTQPFEMTESVAIVCIIVWTFAHALRLFLFEDGTRGLEVSSVEKPTES